MNKSGIDPQALVATYQPIRDDIKRRSENGH